MFKTLKCYKFFDRMYFTNSQVAVDSHFNWQWSDQLCHFLYPCA